MNFPLLINCVATYGLNVTRYVFLGLAAVCFGLALSLIGRLAFAKRWKFCILPGVILFVELLAYAFFKGRYEWYDLGLRANWFAALVYVSLIMCCVIALWKHKKVWICSIAAAICLTTGLFILNHYPEQYLTVYPELIAKTNEIPVPDSLISSYYYVEGEDEAASLAKPSRESPEVQEWLEQYLDDEYTYVFAPGEEISSITIDFEIFYRTDFGIAYEYPHTEIAPGDANTLYLYRIPKICLDII